VIYTWMNVPFIEMYYLSLFFNHVIKAAIIWVKKTFQ